MNVGIFVFTEAYNCGKILNPSLKSYHKYHNKIVHIFGTNDDFDEIEIDIRKHPNNRFIDLSNDSNLKKFYQKGHSGTSYIFAKVFSNAYGFDKVIHFDSDTIFRKESLSLIIDKFNEGYDIVGPVRAYKYNLNNRDDIRNQPDVIQTYFFGMKINKLSKIGISENIKQWLRLRPFYGIWFKDIFRKMCQGIYCPFKYKILDFFDPVSYDALKNGAKIFFLNHNLVGDIDRFGSKENNYPDINKEFPCGTNLFHFAGVGSGYSYLKRKSNPSIEYASWALKRYAVFSKIFFNEEIKCDYDIELVKKIKKIL